MEEQQGHSHHDHRHHTHAEGQAEGSWPQWMNSKAILAIAIIAILAITIYARVGIVRSQGLFEPDGFFYYSVVRATLNNHLSEPQHLGISGFPTHNFIGEAPGLPYMTVIFYLLIGWTGVTALQVMRFLPILVAIIEIVLAYFIAKELSNSRACGFLAMFFMAVSAGNIARTAALVYRGDTFIGIPIMLALLLLIKGVKLKNIKAMAAAAILTAFIVSTGMLVWNGSPYIIVVYMVSLALLTLYSFISWKPDLARAVLIFVCALFLLYLLQAAYLSLHAARPGLALEGVGFLAFYIPLLIGAALAFWLIRRGRIGIFVSTAGRAVIAVIAAVVILGVVIAIFGSYVGTIARASGVYTPTSNSTEAGISYAVGATTQELQKPSFSFLYASFSVGIYLMPIGVLLFLLFNRRLDGRDEEGKTILTPAFLALLAYLAVTAYLQFNAIRYNSLLSIPLALFAAYGLYSIARLAGPIKLQREARYLIAVCSVIVAIALVVFWLHSLVNAGLILHSPLYLGEAAIMIILIGGILYSTLLPRGGVINLRTVVILAVAMVLLYSLVFTASESYASAQADGINTSFLSAMNWLKGNSPANATVLALWPDGSVVEGWANRTSYMDSVGGENSTRIYYFARYLENDTADSQYLYRIGKPQYIVARQYWLAELTGLVAEGVPQNPNNYTFSVLQLAGQPQQNATAQIYRFTNGVYNITMVSQKTASNSILMNYSAYIDSSGNQYLLSRVTLYNASSTAYKEYNASPGSYRANYTLMIFYSGNSLEGAVIMPNGLYQSNLFKLVWLCGWNGCPYSNSTAKIKPVFINNDTRIFSVTYS